MSVPCMVIDEKKVVFGKKNIEEMIEIIRLPRQSFIL